MRQLRNCGRRGRRVVEGLAVPRLLLKPAVEGAVGVFWVRRASEREGSRKASSLQERRRWRALSRGGGSAPLERQNSAPPQLDAKVLPAEREPSDLKVFFPRFYAAALRRVAPRLPRREVSSGSLRLLWKPNILTLLFIPVFFFFKVCSE